MVKKYPKAYSDSTIERKRKEVYNKAEKQIPSNFTSLKNRDIKLLFDLYDKIFFQNQIKKKIEELNRSGNVQIDMKYSTTEEESLHVAGYCEQTQTGTKCTYTLYFPASMYTKMFLKGQKTARTGGIICRDRLQCLQMVFEHELVHLLLFLWDYFEKIQRGKGKGIYSAHGKLFQCMVYSYFRQTKINHELNFGEGADLLSKDDVKIGDKYTFKYQEMTFIGKVIKKNPKRAKLIIETSGRYKNHHIGVPYSLLKRHS